MTQTLLEWRPIAGFPDYEISNHGTVLSKRTLFRKILKGNVTKHGYIAYILRTPQGHPTRFLAHRLVAFAFLGTPLPNQTDVAHKDGNPSNNHVDNLRWSTHSENQMDMRAHGTMQDGEKSCTAKLTEAQIEEIRERVATGPRGTQRRICEELNISPAQISRIVNGHRWKYLG